MTGESSRGRRKRGVRHMAVIGKHFCFFVFVCRSTKQRVTFFAEAQYSHLLTCYELRLQLRQKHLSPLPSAAIMTMN